MLCGFFCLLYYIYLYFNILVCFHAFISYLISPNLLFLLTGSVPQFSLYCGLKLDDFCVCETDTKTLCVFFLFLLFL